MEDLLAMYRIWNQIDNIFNLNQITDKNATHVLLIMKVYSLSNVDWKLQLLLKLGKLRNQFLISLSAHLALFYIPFTVHALGPCYTRQFFLQLAAQR